MTRGCRSASSYVSSYRTSCAIGLTIAAVFAIAISHLHAQGPVRGRNINVVGGPTALTLDPLDMVGDPWRNPQVEPHCAIDSSNPAVIVCSAVDYRWVDLPGGGDGVHLDSWNMIAQSRDGGITWMSRVHPGFANDPNPNAVLKQYKYAADPIFEPLAAGGFIHIGLAANRGELATGAIYASTWFNLSDKEDDAEPVKNVTPGGAIEIGKGNAGQFRDRPDAAVGEPTGRMCTHDVSRKRADGTTETLTLEKPCTPVYVAYATFLSNGGKPITKFHFAKSYNNGKGWTQPIKLNEMNGVGQGVQVIKFPGSRKVMVLWRQGATNQAADALMVAVSTNDGDTFGKATVLANVCPVEWDSTATEFRTRTVPTGAADATRLYVTWADRRHPTTGICDFTQPSRAWMLTSANGEPGTPRLVDPQIGAAHQLFPSVAVGNGKVHVNWLDFRNDKSGDTSVATVNEMGAVLGSINPRNRHTADIYGAIANASANPTFNVYQVSEYIYGKPNGAANEPLEQLHYNVVLARIVRKMHLPFIGDWIQTVGEYMRAKNPVTEPGKWVFNSGTTDMPPMARVFHNFWTDGRDVKLLSNEEYFDAAGNPVPRPYQPPDLNEALINGQLGQTSVYDPTQLRPGCSNDQWTGTKNYEIYGSRTTEGLYAFAPWNNKTNRRPDNTAVQRAFVVVTQHTVPAPSKGQPSVPTKHFRLTIANPSLGSTPVERASFKQFEARPEIRLSLLPGTAAARTVYVYSVDHVRPAVQVDVVELEPNNGPIATWLDKQNGLRHTVFLNPDNTAPANLLRPGNVDPTAEEYDITKFEVHDIVFSDREVEDISLNSTNTGAVVAGQGSNYGTPGWQSPGWQSPGWQSPGWQSPGWQSPGWQSPGWQSPGWQSPGWQSPGWQSTAVSDEDATNGSYRHVRRELKNAGNTTSSYEIRTLVNGASSNLIYQLVAYKLYTTTAMDGCAPKLAGHTQVLLNIPNVNVSAANFNGGAEEDVQNATISIEPGGSVWVDLVVFDPVHRLEPQFDPDSVVIKATPHAVNTQDAENGETEPEEFISDLIILVEPSPAGGTAGTPYTYTAQAIGGKPGYTWSLAAGSGPLPTGLTLSPSGLISGTPTLAGTFPFTLQVQDSVGSTDTQLFSITIVPGPPTQLTFQVQPTNTPAGNTITPDVQVAVRDAHGNITTNNSNTDVVITLLPTGTFTDGSTTTSLATNGIAVFNDLAPERPGTFQLVASSGTLTPATSNTFNVTAVVFVVVNTNDSGAGSLRQAILDANAGPGQQDRIVFAIPGDGPHTISPVVPLPIITDEVKIDGTTQPGAGTGPRIELEGSQIPLPAVLGATADGLVFAGGFSSVNGLAINRFSGNGILIQNRGLNVVEQCYIGTDLSGTEDLGNGANGVHIIDSPTNIIGGSVSGRNIISGNSGEGVRIDGALSTDNRVIANFIGTDVSGTADLGNGASGVYIRRAPLNRVIDNVVSGNNGWGGVTICGNIGGSCGGGDFGTQGTESHGTVVFGNKIGTAADGISPLGNGPGPGFGVSVDGVSNVLIGSTLPAQQNIIANNSSDGVVVFNPPANGIQIRGNSIYANGGLGIDLRPDDVDVGSIAGVSQNDVGGGEFPLHDQDGGPNGVQNFPVLTSATIVGATTNIQGFIQTKPNTQVVVEFFRSPFCDPSGFGEGQTPFASNTVITDAVGFADVSIAVTGVPVQTMVTATATTGEGTSEFSGCRMVLPPGFTHWAVGEGGNGHVYEYVLGNISWTAAMSAAAGRTFRGVSGHLATIGSAGENLAVQRLSALTGDLRAWIGLTDEGTEGTFRWVTNEPVTYANWMTGDPNNLGGVEHFTEIHAVGLWNDATNVFGLNQGYVVEYEVSQFAPTLMDSAPNGVNGDFIDRGFYHPSYPGQSLSRVTLWMKSAFAGIYTISLTARAGTYNGPVIGTSTVTVFFPGSIEVHTPVNFDFPSASVTPGSVVTFSMTQVSPVPDGSPVVRYDVGTCGLTDPDCPTPNPIKETNGTVPPLDTFRRNGVSLRLFGF